MCELHASIIIKAKQKRQKLIGRFEVSSFEIRVHYLSFELPIAMKALTFRTRFKQESLRVGKGGLPPLWLSAFNARGKPTFQTLRWSS
jgi:hypothetical protein